ncbi:hypothetical protein ACIBF5_03420 [Micromonospora sp. NPDC050417]
MPPESVSEALSRPEAPATGAPTATAAANGGAPANNAATATVARR